MSKEAWLPTWQKVKIAEIYRELTKGGKKTTATKVFQETVRYLKGGNPKKHNLWNNYPVSKSSVSGIVHQLRQPTLIEEAKYEDTSWNLGLSKKLGLPSEATADLLEIWALCLAVGLKFTVRQARWACYLRHKKEWFGDSMNQLYQFVCEYATREQICEALHIDPIETMDLDVVTQIEGDEYITALKVGALDINQFHAIPKLLPESGIPETKTTALSASSTVLRKFGINEWVYLLSPDEGVLKKETSWTLYEMTDRIFAYWLNYLGKAPKWGTLSDKEKQDAVLKVKAGILKKLEGKKTNRLHLSLWEPTEVLKLVGYETTHDPEELTYSLLVEVLPILKEKRGSK